MAHRFIIVLAAILAPGLHAFANDQPLRVAIDLDIPPYVMDGATDGLEVAILERTLDGHRLAFLQMPFNDINTAIETDRADVAVSVVASDPNVYYSDDFISFENVAISHASEGLVIDKVADLAGHPVLTWQGAYFELGPVFEAMYAPGGPEHAHYIEVADLQDQVELFWRELNSIAVIDRNIFRYFTNQIGRSIGDASLHAVFAPVSSFRVGFRDAKIRDLFNTGLAQLCSSGGYARLLHQYKVELHKSVCDD